ncbi:family 16 glycosylhydrolase [Lutibacter sp.]|uniref:family 16 glycosylhydrolase n=1 Tax=Lutibacter sp. TaxID=1925666 RepID=UPI001A2BBF76|nr:family 16 glycosylhydrolase [Lutibacter sp.]MBI9042089.1 family 16 glycosylhydrolase [Lutibacter sp.]
MRKIKKISTVLLIISFAFLLGCNSTKTSLKSNINFANNKVVAHRGAWKMHNLPQNSIASLKKAIQLNCSGSEFDVRMTADNVLIVTHDPQYNNLEIEKTNYSELAAFKLFNGEKLPTLKEYLLAGIKNNTTTRLFCEIKPSKISKERGQLIATKVVQMVEALKAKDLLVYISFDYDILKKIIQLEPSALIQYLESNKSLEQLKKDGISGIDYYYNNYKNNLKTIENAKTIGIALNAWTVNDVADMEWLLANKFDFITTDEPILLLEPEEKRAANYKEYNLVWSDEFEYSGLPDSLKWNYRSGGQGFGNNEKQFYLEKSLENSFVKNGKLHIVALKKDIENKHYTSARLTTYNRFVFQYGKIEVMAKLPEGKGTWPAIWMLPESLRKKEESWPLCGEIDIMEHVGKDPNMVHVSLHSKEYNHIMNTQITHFDRISDVFNDFHLYGIEWTPEFMKFYIDNKLFFEAKKGENGMVSTNEGWPFDKPYFLILNLAIGGNWGGEIDDAIFPSEMLVDYVRIYQKATNKN